MALIEYIYILSEIFFYIGVTTTIGSILIYIGAKVGKSDHIVEGTGKMVILLVIIWIIEVALNISMLVLDK